MGSFNKFFEFELSKYDDLYLIPYLPPSSTLAHSGFKASLHASGTSHFTFQQPISCLSLGPKAKVPFDRKEFVEDIIRKRESLFSEQFDADALNKAGKIIVLKTESAVKNFINSEFVSKWLQNTDYIDYYNKVLTNPYYPTSQFREQFPYRKIEIDAHQIDNNIRSYEGDNLNELLLNLRNTKRVEDSDFLGIVPGDESGILTMLGNRNKIFSIDPNDIGSTIRKLPGAIYKAFKKIDYFNLD